MGVRIRVIDLLFGAMALLCCSLPLYGAGTGSLTCGTSGPGMVFAYQGGTTWMPISGELGGAVLDLIEFQGDLYAATTGPGRVWRYEGGTNWTLVGDNLDWQACDLIVYNNSLYVGTAWSGGKLYRYDPSGGHFDYVGMVGGWSGIRAMYCFGPWLQLGDIGYDKFGRYDGSAFYYDLYGSGSCIYDFAEFNGALYAAAYAGRLWRSTDGINWSVVLGYDWSDWNMWELEPFQGFLYAGYDSGSLIRLDTSHAQTAVWTAPSAIISMVPDGDSTLYMGIGAEAGYGGGGSGPGYVYAYDGTGDPTLISCALGDGVQCLYVPPLIIVAVDIKPQSCPNPLNLGSQGVISVAILGTTDFDVAAVDPLTVRLETVAPLRFSYEDVSTPFYPLTDKTRITDCTNAGPDGWSDLVLKFDHVAVSQAIGDADDGDILTLHIKGNLKPEYGGTPIAGEDVVVIIKKKPASNSGQ